MSIAPITMGDGIVIIAVIAILFYATSPLWHSWWKRND